MRIFDFFKKKEAEQTPVINISQAQKELNAVFDNYIGGSAFNGEKFFGGLGSDEIQIVDYWVLRRRSAQLFNENLYARGLIRRLVTNEINKGLRPIVEPAEKILGLP